ncbi:PEP-CTERM sorting domain-containing protein [Reinekea sp. G2M2-21]|uniref:PEP-CTERM sorting domain-containing protein n=1 Tax=Reinekea sp. G2M2-21 TaxID=2788942 RepID=UPI0018AAE1C1|nr:PEP-CTERM sorting domain-containing protein [Reinekea sp. G2M2-21]
MNIKQILGTGFAIATLCGAAQAYYVEVDSVSYDVGEMDTLEIAWDSKNSSSYSDWYTGSASGVNLETAIVSGYLGTDATLEGKTNDGDQVTAYQVFNDDKTEFTGHLAFRLDFGPGYYLIKNASTNAGGTFDTALFLNNNDTSWGFINFSNLDIANLSNLTISHVTEFSSDVAEPATLGLFALGITGLFAARRRKTA